MGYVRINKENFEKNKSIVSLHNAPILADKYSLTKSTNIEWLINNAENKAEMLIDLGVLMTHGIIEYYHTREQALESAY
jgi:hypothetical protein